MRARESSGRWCLSFLLAASAAACGSAGGGAAIAPRASGAPPASAPPAEASSAAAASPAADPSSSARTARITFIEDDYARALAEARRAHRPLFIDAWAPWCHTCVSMRSYVFPDPKLRVVANDFVWASIDTERPENARWVEAHPMTNWPTLWVIDPETESVVLKWSNSATADELVPLLAGVSPGASRDARGPSGSRVDADVEANRALLRGTQATAAGKTDEAIAAYRAALAAAPPGWARRPNTVEALIDRLHAKKDDAACAALAEAELPRLAGGTSRATTSLMGLECASRLPPGDAARKTTSAIEETMRAMALDPAQPILADDRSGLFEALVEAKTDAKRPAEAKELATAWAAFLEREATQAQAPAARAVFDAHRLLAYLAIGAPERAVPMLDASERDFPADYNPPARLARAYQAMHRPADALAAIDRAIHRAYGPRILRLYALKADLLTERGGPADAAAARATLNEALARTKDLHLTGSYAKLRLDLEARANAPEGRAR
jgi:hypothetical protein